MMLITRELAEAIVENHTVYDSYGDISCIHCNADLDSSSKAHEDNCIVVRAKLLLEKEWGIKPDSTTIAESDLFAGAPEGTTHWGEETADHHASWYKLENNQWYCTSVDAWRVHKPLWYGLGNTLTGQRKSQLVERKV